MPMQRRAFLASLAAASLAARLPARAQTNAVSLGDDVFVTGAWMPLRNRTIGVITNQTGATSSGVPVVDAIRSNTDLEIKALFSPEHGLHGDRPAGAYVASYTDESTNLPVYSLYGPTRHPSAAMLAGIDALVFDIQDVGSRAYTFISTMAYAMQTAKEHGIPFWVLDRPNPVESVVEGPVLDPKFSSFIGLYAIPMRHGMTIGELAKLFNDRFGIGADLHVVPMQNYTREMVWPDTGVRWTQTSPNIPTWQTCFPYLCTGLIDNAGVNNGVGTKRPFFYAGKYAFNADALAQRLAAADLPGITFKPAAWSPERGFWAGKTLDGVELIVDDFHTFRAIDSAVHILCAVRDISSRAIDIKEPAALDRDWGTDTLRTALVAGKSAPEILDQWTAEVERFKAVRAKYLLY